MVVLMVGFVVMVVRMVSVVCGWIWRGTGTEGRGENVGGGSDRVVGVILNGGEISRVVVVVKQR